MSMIESEGELTALGWFGVDKSMFMATGKIIIVQDVFIYTV